MTLIGYWPLNETEGDTAYDYSGNENHGNLDSPAQGVEGILGQTAYEFDGESDKVVVADSERLDSVKQNLTLSAWIFFERHEDNTNYERILNKRDTDGYILFVDDSSSATYLRVHFDGVKESVDSNSIIPEGEWSHVAATYNGESVVWYINGVLDKKESASGDISTVGDDLAIGARADSGRKFKGRICEARIYNRALTSLEIQYLYSVGRRGRFVSRKKQP